MGVFFNTPLIFKEKKKSEFDTMIDPNKSTLKKKTILPMPLAILFIFLTTMVNPSMAQNLDFEPIKGLSKEQSLEMVKQYHKKLEVKYNIQRPIKYNVIEHYLNIAPMIGPKGVYKPSVTNVKAICYGVYLTKEGRVLPDPQYADQVTIQNATKAIQRSYELAKLEYLAIRNYNEQIRQARELDISRDNHY